jgi:tetratricopeptide (TPR) repeat protein
MSVLQTTLRTALEHADALFEAGRLPAAQSAFEDLLEKAQERSDHGIEVVARVMIARCLLRRHDVGGALQGIADAEQRLDPDHRESAARLRAAKARILLEADPIAAKEELRAYLRWAEERFAWFEAVDALLLLAGSAATPDDRVSWLQRAADLGQEQGLDGPMGRVHGELAAALEQQGRIEEALDAWQMALQSYRKNGPVRSRIASAWAAGSLAARVEEWPLAQKCLEEAVREAERTDDCIDLLALALADLARLHEASGDVIEARRVMIRALRLAREQDLVRAWPEKWEALRAQARALELDA